jgi:hypothetical protein
MGMVSVWRHGVPLSFGTVLLHSSLAQMGQYVAILLPDGPSPSARDEIAEGASPVVMSMTWFCFYRGWIMVQFI